jgi:hypothetical protein
MEGLRIENRDAYGSRGQMFRTYRSYRCGFRGVTGLRPKNRGAGEGHGWVCQESVECWLEGAELDRCNDSVVFQASTDCWADLISSADPQGQHVAWRSCDERGCWVGAIWTQGGGGRGLVRRPREQGRRRPLLRRQAGEPEPDRRARHGISRRSAGPACAGSRRWAGPTSSRPRTTRWIPRWSGSTTTSCWAWPATSRRGIGRSSWTAGSTTTARGQSGFWFREVKLRGCARGFYLRRCTQPILDGCEVAAPIADGSETWIVRAQDAAQLKVKGCDFDGVANLFALTNCTNGRIYRNGYCNLTGGAEYSDGGGNTGLHGQ